MVKHWLVITLFFIIGNSKMEISIVSVSVWLPPTTTLLYLYLCFLVLRDVDGSPTTPAPFGLSDKPQAPGIPPDTREETNRGTLCCRLNYTWYHEYSTRDFAI
jgi:hypothetical protein